MTNVVIGLAAAIAALREELLLAIEAGDGADMRFRLAPIELSLQVAVTREGEGKIGWKVLGLGGSYESATTQVLKLQLEPVWLKGNGSYTSDFVIGDQYQQPASFGPRDQAGSLRDWSTRRGTSWAARNLGLASRLTASWQS